VSNNFSLLAICRKKLKGVPEKLVHFAPEIGDSNANLVLTMIGETPIQKDWQYELIQHC